MKTVLFVLLVMFLAPVLVFAEETTVEPRIPDIVPGDGFMDAGTWQNPWVIKGPDGQEKGVMVPRIPDLVPGDGFMDAGTPQNPWVIKKSPYDFD